MKKVIISCLLLVTFSTIPGLPQTFNRQRIISSNLTVPITTLSAFKRWCAKDYKNPVSIHYSSDYPNTSVEGYAKYYPMFYLVMAYLLDPNGQGKSIHDIKLIFQDLKNGGSQTNFDAVFENRMRMSTQYYEEHFYELMETYL